MPSIDDIKTGDRVTRLMGGIVKMPLRVTQVDADLIYCSTPDGRVGGWTFCRRTGFEIDHDLGWGPQYGASGSRLTHFIPTRISG